MENVYKTISLEFLVIFLQKTAKNKGNKIIQRVKSKPK